MAKSRRKTHKVLQSLRERLAKHCKVHEVHFARLASLYVLKDATKITDELLFVLGLLVVEGKEPEKEIEEVLYVHLKWQKTS